MRRVANGDVVPRRIHPNATGFVKDLYRIDGVGEEQAQHVETNFFRPLDTDADQALKKIISGDGSPWTEAMRSAWTRYILSLMFRMPTAIKILRSHVADMWKEGVKALEVDYGNRRLPTDPPTFAEYMSLTNSAAPHIGAANLLIHIIDNGQVGPTIFRMRWSRIPIPNANLELLYSDRPICRPLGLNDPMAYIALPVAPRLLFLATHREDVTRKISSMKHTMMAKEINKMTVTQAREFVWASDDIQLPFVCKHMGTASERDIMSPEQRTRLLAVASAECQGPAP